MTAMTGGQILAGCLSQQGIQTIFGLPGVQLDWAFDALFDLRNEITVYHTRHEQAAAYMADGYARTTGRIGTCLVVPGPGLAECYGRAVNCLRLFGPGAVHRRPDQVRPYRRPSRRACMKSTTNWRRSVQS